MHLHVHGIGLFEGTEGLPEVFSLHPRRSLVQSQEERVRRSGSVPRLARGWRSRDHLARNVNLLRRVAGWLAADLSGCMVTVARIELR